MVTEEQINVGRWFPPKADVSTEQFGSEYTLDLADGDIRRTQNWTMWLGGLTNRLTGVRCRLHLLIDGLSVEGRWVPGIAGKDRSTISVRVIPSAVK